MPSMMVGQTLDEAWLEGLRGLPKVEVSPRGIPLTHEDLGAQMFIKNSRHCVLTNPKRQLGYKFLLAEMLWILAGCDLVEPIAPFASHIADFSDDGQRFAGAYGPMIRSQLDYVIDSLRRDMYTRQAVINIWRNSPPPSRDIPCTITCQFLFRNGHLHILVNMRSSDIWLGLPYDCFNFCNLLHVVADLVGVNPGSYLITMGSLHRYLKNEEQIEKLLSFSRLYAIPSYQWNALGWLSDWVKYGPKGDELTYKQLGSIVEDIFHNTFLEELSHEASLHR